MITRKTVLERDDRHTLAIIPFLYHERIGLLLTLRVIFLIGMVILLVPGRVQAQTPKNAGWNLAGGLALRYEDNVFALSDKNRDSFKANSQSFPGVESLDDFVWTPSVGISYRTLASKYPSSLSLGVSGDIYTDNSKKSFVTFRGGFWQEVVAGTHASVGYTFIPHFFLGERLVSSTATQAETLQLHQLVLTLDKNFMSSLNGWVEGRYTAWEFNTSFDALDTVIARGGLGATYKFNRYFMLSSGYLFDAAFGRGGDISGSPRDISFIAHSGFVSPTVKISRPAILRLQYSFQYTRFTTDLPQDLDNFGRRIHSHTVSIGLNYKFTPHISANLSCDRVMKDSNRDFSNYTQNRYLVGMTYSLK
ncbi:MAG: hypothetical protein L0Y56_18595 [Nitrospira sp.]|nr:hypothetical protein [Nitrospira sp.]